jgi:hypothetical protein
MSSLSNPIQLNATYRNLIDVIGSHSRCYRQGQMGAYVIGESRRYLRQPIWLEGAEKIGGSRIHRRKQIWLAGAKKISETMWSVEPMRSARANVIDESRCDRRETLWSARAEYIGGNPFDLGKPKISATHNMIGGGRRDRREPMWCVKSGKIIWSAWDRSVTNTIYPIPT